MYRIILLLLLCAYSSLRAQQPQENYAVDPASVEHAGVPKGEIIKCVFDKSAIYPGTWREYWIYVPKQYRPDKPACVYVNQDGIQWNAPVVFDNLIHNGEMPVTIGVFVMHGRIVAKDQQHAIDRFNRSFEYDGLGDAYVKFITEEILPDVEKHSTSDGRAIHLSKNGNDRAIGGSSSGAVCAFSAAWERPQAFSRVFSAIGTYVGLRGADRYPVLIRKYEPRPIRIFLQDGSGDLNIYGGDWWKANEMMERALVFAGYEVRHIWGEGGHNGRQGTAVFPEAMRWLWKDWPKAVTPGKTQNQVLSDILIPGENWELVSEGYRFTEGVAANTSGDVYFQDIPDSKTYKIDVQHNAVTRLNTDAHKSSGTAFGADGRRYVVAGATKQIIAYSADGKPAVITEGIPGNDLAIALNGNIYVTSPEGKEKPGRIFLIRPGGKKTVVDEGLKFPNGVALSPDQTQLYVAEAASHWIWAYTIAEDGILTSKQRYGWLHTPDDKDDAWPDGLKCDTAGRIYVATRMGIQVLDQLGRVNAVLPLPAGQPSNCCFGGKNFDTLYVSCGGKIFRRKLHTRGANSFEQPIKPPAPRL